MFIKFFKTAASKLFQESPLNPVIVRTLRVFNPTLIHAENKLNENDKGPDTAATYARYDQCKHW